MSAQPVNVLAVLDESREFVLLSGRAGAYNVVIPLAEARAAVAELLAVLRDMGITEPPRWWPEDAPPKRQYQTLAIHRATAERLIAALARVGGAA